MDKTKKIGVEHVTGFNHKFQERMDTAILDIQGEGLQIIDIQYAMSSYDEDDNVKYSALIIHTIIDIGE